MRNYFLIIISAILFISGNSVSAQSSGTDTAGEGQTYLEANFWTGTQSHRNGGMQIYGGRFAYGISKKVEVGLGASFSNPNDSEYPPEVQPSVKYKFYDSETYGVTAAGGAIAYVPIAKRAGTDGFVMVYTNVRKNIKKMNGAGLTVGGYALVGRNKDFGSRKGWNFVYDQPINNKVSFSAQWVTGKNRFGYFTPGLNIAMPKNSSLYVGYSVGNYDYDNHGPYISYSIVR